MGKKAWLFFGNETGGENAAVMYSLTMIYRRLKIAFEAYPKDVICRIGQLEGVEQDALLPDQWLAANPSALPKQRTAESQAAIKRKHRLERRSMSPNATTSQS